MNYSSFRLLNPADRSDPFFGFPFSGFSARGLVQSSNFKLATMMALLYLVVYSLLKLLTCTFSQCPRSISSPLAFPFTTFVLIHSISSRKYNLNISVYIRSFRSVDFRAEVNFICA